MDVSDKRTALCGALLACLVLSSILPAAGLSRAEPFRFSGLSDMQTTPVARNLPDPLTVGMPLEQSMSRRMSVREFTEEPVTEGELATVLWAAFGTTPNGRTVRDYGGAYAAAVYVLLEDAVYRYDPVNHSLVMFREGDFRDEVGWQYAAPVQLALSWDTRKGGEFDGSIQIGSIYQNIAFAANALGLGTVVTGEVPSPIRHIDPPDYETGRIVMPLGHPVHDYDFRYRPLWLSFLPKMQEHETSLSAALENLTEGTAFSGQLTPDAVNQLLWSSYGFSYYLDRSGQEANIVKRHRTVPSAHGYYPFETFAVTADGVYHYYHNLLVMLNRIPVDFLGLPILPLMTRIDGDDRRADVAAASDFAVSSAPLNIVVVLNLDKTHPSGLDDFSPEYMRWLWHLEAGSMLHNVLLQTTSLDCEGAAYAVTDDAAVMDTLSLSGDYDPMYVVAVGS
jgi:hypothetical protein